MIDLLMLRWSLLHFKSHLWNLVQNAFDIWNRIYLILVDLISVQTESVINLYCLVKISADDILKYLSQKIGFHISCLGDNLYKKSKPIFWEK